MREIPKAILAVKQSLSINPSHVPSWHLLALLLSSQKDHEKALSICAVGLKESVWDLGQMDDVSSSDMDGEEYLALCITQAVLHDQVHGPEAALEHQGALFSLYSRVFSTDLSSMGESLYDIQSIRRRNHSNTELASTPAVTGRPRAGSTVSARSRNGGGPDIGLAPNGGYTNSGNLGKNCYSFFFATVMRPSMLMITSAFSDDPDVPRHNYAPSIASSTGSTHSRFRRIPPPPTVHGAVSHTPLTRSALGLPPSVQRPTTKAVMRTARANKVLVTLWLLSASTFRRLGKTADALRAIEEAERVDASNPDVWYQVRFDPTCGIVPNAMILQNTSSIL